VAQAMWQGKLFHIDLNDQKVGRFDQDFRFGSEGIKDDFFLVRLLESSGYSGPKHFDCRPYRNTSGEGIWEFARGCMRTYLMLAAKAREFDNDPRVKEAQVFAGVTELAVPTVGSYSRETADRLLAEKFDPELLASRNYGNDGLDQLVIDRILGM
jgi:xylose isomerase